MQPWNKEENYQSNLRWRLKNPQLHSLGAMVARSKKILRYRSREIKYSKKYREQMKLIVSRYLDATGLSFWEVK